MKRLRRHLPDLVAILSLLALTWIVYSPILTWGFTGTDTLSLIETGRVVSPRDLVDIFRQPLMAGTLFTQSALYYRPMTTISFGLDYALWGLRPAGYHFTSLCLHTANVVLLFVLLRTQGRMMLVSASLGAAVFALHPSMVEVVPVISRRQDALALLLGLLALMSYRSIENRQKHGRVLKALSLVLLALAVLAKEIAAVFVVLIPADSLLARPGGAMPDRKRLSGFLKECVPYVVTFALVLGIRLVVLQGMGGQQAWEGASAMGRLWQAGVLVPLRFVEELQDPGGLVRQSFTSLSGGIAWLMLALATVGMMLVGWWYTGPRDTRKRNTVAGASWPTILLAVVAALAWAGSAQLFLTGFPPLSRFFDGVTAGDQAWQLVGLAVLGGMLLGALAVTVIRGGPRPGSLGTWSSLGRLIYYSLWILLPLALYMLTGTFSSRLVYLPAAGLGALLAVLVDEMWRALFARPRTASTRRLRTAAIGIAPLLALSVVLLAPATPSLAGLGEWKRQSELADRFLADLEAIARQPSPCDTLVIHGLPRRGVIGLDVHTLQSWVRLNTLGKLWRIRVEERIPFDAVPESVAVSVGACKDGRLEVFVRAP